MLAAFGGGVLLFCRSCRGEKGGSPLEHFQFETRCVANYTACHFVEKARFFPLASVRAARCIRGMPLLVIQDFLLIKAFIGYGALKMFPRVAMRPRKRRGGFSPLFPQALS